MFCGNDETRETLLWRKSVVRSLWRDRESRQHHCFWMLYWESRLHHCWRSQHLYYFLVMLVTFWNCECCIILKRQREHCFVTHQFSCTKSMLHVCVTPQKNHLWLLDVQISAAFSRKVRGLCQLSVLKGYCNSHSCGVACHDDNQYYYHNYLLSQKCTVSNSL